jgi:hypothetical protein
MPDPERTAPTAWWGPFRHSASALRRAAAGPLSACPGGFAYAPHRRRAIADALRPPRLARRDAGIRRAVYIVAPRIHGLNSSSPMPCASLRLGCPDATAISRSKISVPTSAIVAPDSTRPASMSMSSRIRP